MEPKQPMKLGAGEAVLVDAIGTLAILTQPTDRANRPEVAVVLDLEGKLNKQPDRYTGRFLLAPGQVGELIADLIVAVHATGRDSDSVMADVMEAIVRAQQKLDA